jgi:hypothetical protein
MAQPYQTDRSVYKLWARIGRQMSTAESQFTVSLSDAQASSAIVTLVFKAR